MTSNLHTLDPMILEYLELNEQELLLNDQLKSIRSHIRQLKPQIRQRALTYPEQNIPIIPTALETNRFGALGSIRFQVRMKPEQFTRKMMLEQSEAFYRKIIPEGKELASSLALQHTDWLCDHRAKVPVESLCRSYAGNGKKRKAVPEDGGSSSSGAVKRIPQDPHRPKTLDALEQSNSAQQMRWVLSQHLPQVMQRMEHTRS
jgi:hypothetical protein